MGKETVKHTMGEETVEHTMEEETVEHTMGRLLITQWGIRLLNTQWGRRLLNKQWEECPQIHHPATKLPNSTNPINAFFCRRSCGRQNLIFQGFHNWATHPNHWCSCLLNNNHQQQRHQLDNMPAKHSRAHKATREDH